MKLTKLAALLSCALLLLPVGTAQAHKRWLLPTDFALSDAETVTVDFTASNNIFYVDKPMPLKGVRALAPDGKALSIDAPHEGKRRSSFDLEIEQPGTYRLLVQGDPVHFLSYTLPGEDKPHYERGPLNYLKGKVPAQAQDIKYAESTALIETYISLGAPTAPPAIATTRGITVQAVTHPNELYSDEPGEFIVYLNGKPAANRKLLAMPEGTRYRDGQGQAEFVTDDNGRVAVDWSGPGRYLLEMALEEPGTGGEFAMHYYNYFLTVEVLLP